MPSRSPTLRIGGAALAAGATLALAGAATASAKDTRVVADGLANPRGLAWSAGKLYVAEAGRGGSGACTQGPEGNEVCIGTSGRITRVNPANGRKRALVKGLPSIGDKATGGSAIGPQDVSFQGTTAYFTVGLGGDPTKRAALGPDGPRMAWLYRKAAGKAAKPFLDLGAYEATHNADQGDPTSTIDSNPFSVDATLPGKLLVTDAGANALYQVSAKKRVKVLTVFPSKPTSFGGGTVPYQAVPTGVVRTPKGAALLGQLTGFPFPAGAANVYQQVGKSAPKVWRKGFTNVIDVALGLHGDRYVLQLTTGGLLAPAPNPGRLFHIAGGKRTEIAAGELTAPAGLLVAPNGDVYVSDNGFSGTDGRIVRIPARKAV